VDGEAINSGRLTNHVIEAQIVLWWECVHGGLEGVTVSGSVFRWEGALWTQEGRARQIHNHKNTASNIYIYIYIIACW